MESIETLNKRLLEIYGKFETGGANWRIVHSSNQFEIQKGKFTKTTENGIYLGEFEGFKEVPKYAFIQPPKYLLERVVPVVNAQGSNQLITKLSYECIWAFGEKGDPAGKAIYPCWEAIEFIIKTVLGHHTSAPYKEGDPIEEKEKRIADIYENLFGDDTETSDALRYHEGIVVPNKEFKNESVLEPKNSGDEGSHQSSR
jgi:hypothetical protein